jgi:hypothetical protein
MFYLCLGHHTLQTCGVAATLAQPCIAQPLLQSAVLLQADATTDVITGGCHSVAMPLQQC